MIALAAAMADNLGHDLAHRVNRIEVMLAACIAFIVVLRRTDEPRPSATSLQGEYLDGVIRAGVVATVRWGIAGFAVDVLIASQLAFPALNFSELTQGYTNFGKLRPLHTSAVILALAATR